MAFHMLAAQPLPKSIITYCLLNLQAQTLLRYWSKYEDFQLRNAFEVACKHDDVIKWKHFACYWPFVQGILWSPVNSLHKGQWHRALMFSLICAWIIGWINSDEASDLRQSHSHYDITVIEIDHFVLALMMPEMLANFCISYMSLDVKWACSIWWMVPYIGTLSKHEMIQMENLFIWCYEFGSCQKVWKLISEIYLFHWNLVCVISMNLSMIRVDFYT